MFTLLRKVKFEKVRIAVIPLCIFFFLFSCVTPQQTAEFLYFKSGSDTVTVQKKETIILPSDILSIQVFSKTLNQEQAAIFNIPTNANASNTTGSTSSTNSGGGTASAGQGYEVSALGTIEMPVIGTIKASGLTRDQLQALLVDKITNYVKNPTVIVRFADFNVNILGEVKSPGTKKFAENKVTLIDALSAAGDLTDFGKRDNVKVIREQNGKKIYYAVDLRSKNVFSSPVYILQPNDIIYVEPNKNKIRTLSVNTETQRKVGLYSSFLSIGLSLVALFFYITRK
ncbi:MAG: polysaccharide biosynthesis/export family protein [Bacteroidota bacterium]|nr:polysaccharide biosynthesis/export family protein [Bacteroidota bacterium]